VRGVGYVLAGACSHEVTTSVGKFRADNLAGKLIKQIWQWLSAGSRAKGQQPGPESGITGDKP
jgi:hypothetical protein